MFYRMQRIDTFLEFQIFQILCKNVHLLPQYALKILYFIKILPNFSKKKKKMNLRTIIIQQGFITCYEKIHFFNFQNNFSIISI